MIEFNIGVSKVASYEIKKVNLGLTEKLWRHLSVCTSTSPLFLYIAFILGLLQLGWNYFTIGNRDYKCAQEANLVENVQSS